ncbi:MAG TPA: aminotransferase class V-fold PLP-dependent enzyme [Terriglobales bacterium]|nr:aminotransferase class V-fold PLP-dependent enzyme [Terriglobales bacterium]
MLESTRQDFVILKTLRKGKPPIYFDNACTTLVPRQVVHAITEYYDQYPACGEGRSRYWFAKEVTSRIEGDPSKRIEGSRQTIQHFINAKSDSEIIFTSNTSHAINMVALGFKFKPEDTILLTDIEHNSNLTPWLRLRKKARNRVDYVESKPDYNFDLERLKEKLESERIRLVSMAYTSNLTGYTIPAKEIIRMAHHYGARVLLDAAQTVPHRTVDVQDLDVDFLAFSMHKMCGPRGVGILYGKEELLGQKPHEDDESDLLEPYMTGGGTVSDTTYDSYDLLQPPERFETGIQNYPGQIAAGTAVKYVQQIGLDKISSQESELNRYLTNQLLNRYGEEGWFNIIGPSDASERAGILTFEIKRPNCTGIAEELDEKSNVMIRDGAFCVHSYLNNRLGRDWSRPRLPTEHTMLYRISLYFYNTLEECQVFLAALDAIFQDRGYTRN